MRYVIFLVGVALGAAWAEVEVGGIVLKEGPLDQVKVEQHTWWWQSGANKMPAVSVSLTSGRFKYELRHDQAPGRATIGLSAPTTANWYQAGMLALLINGESYPIEVANAERIDLASGRRGRVTFSWSNATADVRYTFVLFSDQDRLLLSIDLAPKVPVKSLALRLQNYAGGFNRQPDHYLWTPLGEVTAKGGVKLDPAKEFGLLLADRAADPAADPEAPGPSALVYDPAVVAQATSGLGGYGVPVQLTCDPAARSLRLCFWEYPQTPVAEAVERFRAGHESALQQLRDPATFAAEVAR